MEGSGKNALLDFARTGSLDGGDGMNAARVILVTVAGPAGQMDVGVRSDATVAELAAALGSMLGVSLTRSVAEHRSPPRPGSRQGQRAMLSPATSLAAAGVADGDLVLFRRTEEGLGAAPAPPHGVLRNPVPSAAQPGLPRGTRPSQAGSPGTVPPPRPAAEPRSVTASQPAAEPRHARANGPADAAAVPEEETRPHDRH
jgi:WXG100 protein secretion system (Wss), protein YukD